MCTLPSPSTEREKVNVKTAIFWVFSFPQPANVGFQIHLVHFVRAFAKQVWCTAVVGYQVLFAIL